MASLSFECHLHSHYCAAQVYIAVLSVWFPDISKVLLPKIELISLQTHFVKLMKNAGWHAGMNRAEVKAWPCITTVTVGGGLNVNCKCRLYVSVSAMIISSMRKRSHTVNNHFLLVFDFFEVFGPSVPAAFQTWQCIYKKGLNLQFKIHVNLNMN